MDDGWMKKLQIPFFEHIGIMDFDSCLCFLMMS